MSFFNRSCTVLHADWRIRLFFCASCSAGLICAMYGSLLCAICSFRCAKSASSMGSVVVSWLLVNFGGSPLPSWCVVWHMNDGLLNLCSVLICTAWAGARLRFSWNLILSHPWYSMSICEGCMPQYLFAIILQSSLLFPYISFLIFRAYLLDFYT